MVTELELRREIAAGEDPERPIRRVLRRARAWIERHPRLRFAYRFAIGAIGALVVVAGVILMPLPGPGTLVFFLGFAILGTEFAWAARIAAWVKRMVDAVLAWWRARRATAQGA
ncbi:TIGR02611 family protein [Agromyces sp. SYSU T00194]|uniref:TIGR02611 family protein n=1 Tax=Agromyces chitinivorans TaxID=3158560 RepID=UPI003396D729